MFETIKYKFSYFGGFEYVFISFVFLLFSLKSWHLHTNEPPHDKTNKMTYAPSEDSASTQSDQSSLSAWRNTGPLTTLYLLSTQRRIWSDWVDALADLSLRWMHIILLVLSCGGSYITDFGSFSNLVCIYVMNIWKSICYYNKTCCRTGQLAWDALFLSEAF